MYVSFEYIYIYKHVNMFEYVKPHSGYKEKYL